MYQVSVYICMGTTRSWPSTVTVCVMVALAVGLVAGTVLARLVLDLRPGVLGSSHLISGSVYGCMPLFISMNFFCCANFLDLRNTHHHQDQHHKCDKHGIHCSKVAVVCGYTQYPTVCYSRQFYDHGYRTQYEYAHDTGKKATESL